jgi:hypothetical protein
MEVNCLQQATIRVTGRPPSVAVEMAVASHPPHRPVLAGTTAYGSYLGSTRRVLTSGSAWKRRPRTRRYLWDTLSLICVRHVLSTAVFSLVTGLPSTTSAASITTGLVRQLRQYYADVRLLACVHIRIVLLASRTDPAACVGHRMPARSLGSRACSFSTCVWLLDYAGPGERSRFRSRQCCLPVARTRSAPGIRFSKLDSSPVDASVYTSPGTCGTQRKTRGQDGSLLLSCGALSSPTTRRFIPTLALAYARGFQGPGL